MGIRHWRRTTLFAVAPALLLAACAQTPMGPTVQVMPGPGKSFETFQYEQAGCKQFAEQAVAGQAENANIRGVAVGVVGTALGAGLGGAIGGGHGAGIGAASGALGGGALGAGSSANAQYGIQQQYDNAFSQCMYSKGDMVPGYGPMMVQSPSPAAYGYDPRLTHAVQVQLNRLGYLSGPADGAMGPNTSRAIGTYEQTVGLPVDGVPSEPLLARLQATP
ncbi:MAG TPA: peptidoglycan-binding domain-containing protein [Acetobacteraceae bacterium]|nr:peptidoglycan-binding domain-containing protein [Acetobacteraceae bacterium]